MKRGVLWVACLILILVVISGCSSLTEPLDKIQLYSNGNLVGEYELIGRVGYAIIESRFTGSDLYDTTTIVFQTPNGPMRWRGDYLVITRR